MYSLQLSETAGAGINAFVEQALGSVDNSIVAASITGAVKSDTETNCSCVNTSFVQRSRTTQVLKILKLVPQASKTLSV